MRRQPSRMPYLIFAFLVGALLSPLVANISPMSGNLYDKIYPVVTMVGKIKGRNEDSVDVQMGGTKHRSCKFLRLQGFTRLDGVLRDSNITRIDAKSEGITKPLGTFDIGVWRVWPINGGTDVVVYVNHDCDGRIVVTKIADAQL